jgi:hypothetical protein
LNIPNYHLDDRTNQQHSLRAAHHRVRSITEGQNYHQLTGIYQRNLGHGCCVADVETAFGVPQ